MSFHHVLILGCGRSGTSIFGAFFDHLPPYQYRSEIPFDDIGKMDLSQPIAIKVPRESATHPSLNGLSFPLEKFFEYVPEPRTIYWQVRHPLDTICSLKVGISKNWGHHPRPNDWESWLDRPLVEQCAHHWDYINRFGFAQVAQWASIQKFEDMIADPAAFAQNLRTDIMAGSEQYDSEIEEWVDRVQNSNNAKFREASTSKAYSTNDHSVRVGRWKENLTEDELALVLPIIRETSAQFGYSLPG